MNIRKSIQKIDLYQRWMLASVVASALLRLVLIAFHWPFTESDEGNMGLLAMHVAFQGDHPIFFYGGNYLGPLEGYAAAPLFRLLGASLFALRLPLVLFFSVFLVSMYYLVRLLTQSERFALASVMLLGLGSPNVLFLQLRASGEYPELEMFATLMCLLATWLALTSPAPAQRKGRWEQWKRTTLYGLLGLIVGLALWVDLLILPFATCMALLLGLFCRRELLHWQGLALLLGCAVGAFPLIYYNLSAPWAENSWFVLQKIEQGSAVAMLAQHLTWVNQLSGTLFLALPMATGGSLNCPPGAFPPAGTPSAATLPCVLFQGGWGIGYVVLWFIGVALVVVQSGAIWRYGIYPPRGGLPGGDWESRQEAIRQSARLMILGSVGLTLLLYAVSPAPATVPDTSFRYLTCLLLAIPVLLWPVWQGLNLENIASRGIRTKVGLLLRAGMLLLVAATFASGTVRTYLEVPMAQELYQRDEAIVQDLLRIGATRIYSEYWTCNVLTFLSHEKIICSTLDEGLKPGYDRYLPYRFIVRASPHPTYIFPIGTRAAEAIQQRIRSTSAHYRYYTFEGYVVYQTT